MKSYEARGYILFLPIISPTRGAHPSKYLYFYFVSIGFHHKDQNKYKKYNISW